MFAAFDFCRFSPVFVYFFFQYLQTLHLQSCDLLDIFGGISFFPLDKMTYLKIQSFVNRVEESLSLIKYTAFLYNDQLIWYWPSTSSGILLNTVCSQCLYRSNPTTHVYLYLWWKVCWVLYRSLKYLQTFCLDLGTIGKRWHDVSLCVLN